jgi:hypothetical protein
MNKRKPGLVQPVVLLQVGQYSSQAMQSHDWLQGLQLNNVYCLIVLLQVGQYSLQAMQSHGWL